MKTLIRSTVIGSIFTLILGTLLHFAYEFFGENFFVSLFSPINESIWEHLKLLFFPVLLYTLWESITLKEYSPYIFTANMIGLILGLISIPLLYYIYTAILGTNYLWLDISIFIVGIIVTFLVRTYLLVNSKVNNRMVIPALCIFLILIIAFFWFTISPPKSELFRSPDKEVNSLGTVKNC